MDPLVTVLVAAVVVIAVGALSTKVGVAAPLALVVVGVIASFVLPLVGFTEAIEVEPEFILAGILPPLLFSSAVALPTMDFRRDFSVISGLAVLLVLLTSVLVGLVFWRLLPGLNLAAGVAIGAIVSPTDAVATKIVKRVGAPSRVVTVLEGEGLLNDATAMVVLRSAIAATAAAVGFGTVIGGFVWAVIGATLVGFLVGRLGLSVRTMIHSAALTTAVSFVVPFAAYLIGEHIGASGLVAVVVAGLVTGHRSAEMLAPRERMFDYTNWETLEMMLEGGVFLLMGLELRTLIQEVHGTHDMLWAALGLALLSGSLVLALRIGYIAPLLRLLQRRAARKQAGLAELEQAQVRLNQDEFDEYAIDQAALATPRRSWMPAAGQYAAIVSRRIADTAYLTQKPLNRPEGVLLVAAGLKGVLTLAAAQSLPRTFPHRSLVVLIAYIVALVSLLAQGLTLPWLTERLGLRWVNDGESRDAHQIHLDLNRISERLLDSPELVRPDGSRYDPEVIARVRSHVVEAAHDSADQTATAAQQASYRELWLRVLQTQRAQLLNDRRIGLFDARALDAALSAVDAEQMMIEMKPGDWLT